MDRRNKVRLWMLFPLLFVSRTPGYAHDNGLVPATSVLRGTTGDKVTSGRTDDVRNVSTSAGFFGVSVREGDYALDSLPAGYQSTPDSHGRRDAPWMPDTPGNNRTADLSGNTTRTSYFNSSVSSHGSPALSVGQARNRRPTATDSTVTTNRVPAATIPGTIPAGSITPAVH